MYATTAIHAKCDDVIKMLMQKLEIPIPEFKRKYRLKVSKAEGENSIYFTGVDDNGGCYTLFKLLKITGLGLGYATLPDRKSTV